MLDMPPTGLHPKVYVKDSTTMSSTVIATTKTTTTTTTTTTTEVYDPLNKERKVECKGWQSDTAAYWKPEYKVPAYCYSKYLI